VIVTGQETEFRGPHGGAQLIPWADTSGAAETVCSWLLTAPAAHPLWTQYALSVVRLRDDAPGFPPPRRQFTGATHELFVVALNPEHGPFTVEKMLGYQDTGAMPHLLPVNVAHQVEATDDEARLLACYAATAVVHGLLCPETSDAPERIRMNWTASMVKTLAHVRGEEHAP
jgi:hypothetical protein